jgi:hypothetical protein
VLLFLALAAFFIILLDSLALCYVPGVLLLELLALSYATDEMGKK